MKVKDKIFLGIITGLIAGVPLTVIDYVLYYFHINAYNICQIAASVYFKAKDVDTIPAVIVGITSHFSVVAMGSIVVCYLLYLTGQRYYLLKGLGVGLAFWLFNYGVILRGHISRIDPVDGGTNLVHLVGHVLGGLSVGWLIIKLADNKVWER